MALRVPWQVQGCQVCRCPRDSMYPTLHPVLHMCTAAEVLRTGLWAPEACLGLLSPLPFFLPRKVLAHLCQSLHCSEPPGPWQSPRASGTCAQPRRGPLTLPGRYSDLRWTPGNSGPTRLPAYGLQAMPLPQPATDMGGLLEMAELYSSG